MLGVLICKFSTLFPHFLPPHTSVLPASGQVYFETLSPYLADNMEAAGLNTAEGYAQFLTSSIPPSNVSANVNDDLFVVSEWVHHSSERPAGYPM